MLTVQAEPASRVLTALHDQWHLAAGSLGSPFLALGPQFCLLPKPHLRACKPVPSPAVWLGHGLVCSCWGGLGVEH